MEHSLTQVNRAAHDMTPAVLGAGLRRWIASGAAQGPDGAFHAWRDEATGGLAFAYPEITGYALTWLAGRAQPTEDELEAAVRAADWLVARIDANDLSAHAGWDGGAVYTFDLAMIATGLLRFGSRFGGERHLATAARLVRLIQEQMSERDGLPAISPVVPIPSRRSGWSVDGQAHLLKAVQCLLLADRCEVADAVGAAAMLIERAPALQQQDGRFVTEQRDEVTMLHPHLYAIEGLWVWGVARSDESALAQARAAAAWVWRHQLASGGFPRSVAASPAAPAASSSASPQPVEQCDVTAQAIRMALALNLAPPGMGAAIARLGELARPTEHGLAMVYQPASGETHHNMWATMFAAQAMEMAIPGAGAPAWQDLV